jgi:GTP-dependent dephospho-CoA kinase
MDVVYAIKPELLEKFRRPFGVLLQGTFSETNKQLSALVKKEKPPKVVSVGDTVSKNLHKHGINPQLSITDNKSLRRRVKPATFPSKKVFHAKNPQGTITEEAIKTVRDALQASEDAHVIVDGEEDLLTLIAVLYAPEDALVVYGQPHEGIVVVKVTAEKKAEARALLEAMACSKS